MRWHLAVVALLAAVPAEAATLSGQAIVIDGDTIEIEGRRIRLFGIDAPELSQTCDRSGENWACGQASAERLRSLIGSYDLSCTGDELDEFGRLVAVCTLSGVDLNRTMVAQGWAIAFRRYSDRYVDDEARARGGRLGLWAASFVLPEQFRAAERQAAVPPRQARQAEADNGATPTSCLIKGNRSRRGDWIYRVPGSRYYEETRAEEMFCTEAEAQAAGYRQSRAD